jgi:hypothetical protein
MLKNLFEIDAVSDNDIKGVIDFARVNACAAIVVKPDDVAQYVAIREMSVGKYKIICLVDFAGLSFGMDKLRDLPHDAMSADGFDIVCSYKGNKSKISNEISSLTKFLKNYNSLYEVRWSIDVQKHGLDDLKLQEYLFALKTNRSDFIRLSTSISTIPEIMSVVNGIRSIVNMPIKIPVKSYKDIFDIKDVRYDLTLKSAREILDHVKKEETKQTKQEPTIEQNGEEAQGTLGQDVEGINN